MSDDDPISYLALDRGTPVLTDSGTEIGPVEHVLQDDALDFFDGIVVTTASGIRFVDSDRIGRITAGGVHTTLTDEEAAHLPAPDGAPVLEADPDDFAANGLSAWFGRTFMREHWTRKRDD